MVPWRPEMVTASTVSIPTSTTHSSSSDAAAAALSLNGPESEPVLYQPERKQPQRKQDYDDHDPRCRSCHSTAIVTDWNQGDRICTNCGVIVEEHIPVDIEWRDFNDADDIVKGKPSGARSGLVPVDETKYVGGLQPTRLSKHAFGGDNSLLLMGKRLKATNKRLDLLMEKQYKKSVQDAKLDRKIRLKQHSSVDNDDDAEDGEILTLRPEMEQLILQEEEDAHRMQAALYAEKWSLDRALLIFGDYSPEQQEEREDTLARMDKTLRKSSEDMYTAYTILIKGAHKLHLPDRVRNEVIHRLVRFVTRRDGFFIKGVSSRLSKNHDPTQRKKAAEQLREHNKLKQMGALASAILFLTARSLGWTRSITEVCSSIEPPATSTIIVQQQQQKHPFVKTKHCSKAIHEIKVTFPEMAADGTTSQTSQPKGTKAPPHSSLESNDSIATSNFADHSLRRLQLPPVAEVCARALLLYCRDRQVQMGRNSGTKLSTLCASVTYFVCSAGTIMQRLAQQTAQRQQLDCNKPKASKIISGNKRMYAQTTKSTPRKKHKSIDRSSNVKQEECKRVAGAATSAKLNCKDSDDDDDTVGDTKRPRHGNDDDDDDEPFDVFSHAPIVEDQTEKHKYEMRRMWDAWSEQMSWHRSVSEVEQSCGVSRTVLLDFYKTHLYPQRNELLKVLGDAVKDTSNQNGAAGEATGIMTMLRGAPLARILLIHISTAAPLMNIK